MYAEIQLAPDGRMAICLSADSQAEKVLLRLAGAKEWWRWCSWAATVLDCTELRIVESPPDILHQVKEVKKPCAHKKK